MGVKRLYYRFEVWLGPTAPRALESDSKTHLESRMCPNLMYAVARNSVRSYTQNVIYNM